MIAIRDTPIERLAMSQRVGENLWIKRDDLTHPIYGGNKARKLAHVLAEAERRGVERVVTMGAIGSHHVLATTIFGGAQGLEIAAVLTPQPRTEHAAEIVRAAIGAGLKAYPARSPREAVAAFARVVRRGDLVVPLGGSSALGVRGYVDAAREIVAAVARGDAPHPTVVVVAAGSGGTAAGLALGFAESSFRTRVLAIAVASPPVLVRGAVRALVGRSAWRSPALARAALALVDFDDRFLGAGYGVPSAAGLDAIDEAAAHGVVCDATYTSKALAAAIARARIGGTVLYVHTLSSAPLAPLLEKAPLERELSAALRALLT